jgi:hypothetical protein
MSAPFLVRSLVLAFVALLAGCATLESAGDTSGRVADAPTFTVGTRWTYRGSEGFRAPLVWTETHEVTAIGPDGIHVRVTYEGPQVHGSRDEILIAPGLVKQGALMDIDGISGSPTSTKRQAAKDRSTATCRSAAGSACPHPRACSMRSACAC